MFVSLRRFFTTFICLACWQNSNPMPWTSAKRSTSTNSENTTTTPFSTNVGMNNGVRLNVDNVKSHSTISTYDLNTNSDHKTNVTLDGRPREIPVHDMQNLSRRDSEPTASTEIKPDDIIPHVSTDPVNDATFVTENKPKTFTFATANIVNDVTYEKANTVYDVTSAIPASTNTADDAILISSASMPADSSCNVLKGNATHAQPGDDLTDSYHAIVVPRCYTFRCKDQSPYSFHQWRWMSSSLGRSVSMLITHFVRMRLDCYCDIACAYLGDCCYDYFGRDHLNVTQTDLIRSRIPLLADDNFPSEIKLLIRYGKCVTVRSFEAKSISALMITKCPDDLPQRDGMSREMRFRCEQHPEPFDIPVTYVWSRSLVFANIFCSRCHRVNDEDVEVWRAGVVCSNMTSGEILTLKNVTEETQKPDSRCTTVIFTVALGTFVRTCRKRSQVNPYPLISLNKTADSPYAATKTQVWCDRYLHPVSLGSALYANPHCVLAKSPQIDVECVERHMKCEKRFYDDSDGGNFIGRGTGLAPSLTLLFDFSQRARRHISVQVTILHTDIGGCVDGHLFDRFLQKCRQVRCTNGMELVNGSCHDHQDSLADPKTQILFNASTQYTMLFIFTDPISITEPVDMLATVVRHCLDLPRFWQSEEKSHKVQIKSVLAKNFTGQMQTKTKGYGSIPRTAQTSSVTAVVEVVLESSSPLAVVFREVTSLVTVYRTCGLPVAASVTFSNTAHETPAGWRCPVGLRKILKDIQVVFSDDGSLLTSSPSNGSRVLYNLSHVPFVHEVSDLVPPLKMMQITVCEAPVCDMMQYLAEDAAMLMQKLNSLDPTLKVNRSLLWVTDDIIYVCVQHVYSVRNGTDVSSRVGQLLTSIGLALSIVCLVLTLLLYSLLPGLRNHHGQKLMCMMGTFLLAQALFWLSRNITDDVACQGLAMMLHFLWLSAFSWMSVVSLDLAQTFRMNSVPCAKRAPTTCCSGNLLRQAALSFVLPASLVVIFVVLHVLGDGFVRYGRTQGGCWLCTQEGVLAGAVIPVGLSLVFNLICFAVTLVSIESNRMSDQEGSRWTSDGNGQGGCWRRVLYLKLSLVTGGPWILSYLAEALDAAWLLVLSATLNSLQGVLVFLIFACNKNVYNLLRRRVAMVRGKHQRARSAENSELEERTSNGLRRLTATLSSGSYDLTTAQSGAISLRSISFTQADKGLSH